ncbi:hypothetical protein BCR32DRAFT_281866 [Anaeromyces robustus]|uniref:Uncharacterized protein n=1 Tax=Anaeromyces robustus TaxID=1754192 RepID=A0A1Y1WZM6_9FUNG|nr:hypothetical protein BCR32DRAFT_281866 [Anaeromyces robustus]|eukprot:ORX78892.1 hypothetical protein BCR32DRAFT_281866 [Anaeromyces robustus]
MKLSTILLTFAAATLVYSENLSEAELKKKYMAQDDAYDNGRSPFLMHVGKECKEDLVKDNLYIDCFGAPPGRININTVNEKCAIFDSDKCKKFYDNPSTATPKCANDEAFKKLLPFFKPEFTGKSIYCLRNANDEICPVSKKILSLDGYNSFDMKKSCKSAACRESLLEYCNANLKYNEDYYSVQTDNEMYKSFNITAIKESYNECISILNSKDCISKAQNDKANAENANDVNSGSIITSKSSSAMLFTIIVLLAYLF